MPTKPYFCIPKHPKNRFYALYINAHIIRLNARPKITRTNKDRTIAVPSP